MPPKPVDEVAALRKEEAKKARGRHIDRLPLNCEPHKAGTAVLDKPLLLVPADLPVRLLVGCIRRRLREKTQSEVTKVKLFVNDAAMEEGYVADHYLKYHNSEDLMLNIKYAYSVK